MNVIGSLECDCNLEAVLENDVTDPFATVSQLGGPLALTLPNLTNLD